MFTDKHKKLVKEAVKHILKPINEKMIDNEDDMLWFLGGNEHAENLLQELYDSEATLTGKSEDGMYEYTATMNLTDAVITVYYWSSEDNPDEIYDPRFEVLKR